MKFPQRFIVQWVPLKQSLLVLISIFFVGYPFPVYSALQAQVDRANIAIDEVLTLIISSNDHLSISPDLTPLKKDFEIVGTSRNSQFNMINGSMKMDTQWQIALLPKHAGDITLPAITAGKEQTEPQIIHVLAIKKTVTPQAIHNSDFYFEASVIPKELFIQEQFVYTLKLYFNKSIENPYLMGPDLLDAKIAQNGQDIIYNSVKNGKYYRVLERSYLITPKNTGKFTIDPPVLKGYLESSPSSTDLYNFSNHTLRPIKVVGPTLTITVKPKPVNFSGQWFPAKKVTIHEQWETNPPMFKEGEPATRIVEVTAVGATGEQIPTIAVDGQSNINSYPEQPIRETNTNGEIQTGTLKQKIVFIPTASGKITLPGIKIRWWNSVTQKEQVAELPSKIIQVQPTLTKTVTSPAPLVALPTNPVPPGPIAVKKSTHNISSYIWPSLAMLFVALWLATMWLWRRQAKQANDQTMTKFGKPADALKQLKRVCYENNPKQARKLLLKWSVDYWQNRSLHSLTDVVHQLEHDQASLLLTQIMQLEAVFYGKNKASWRGTPLWVALEQYLEAKKEKRTNEDDNDPLPPLYCNG